MCDNMRAVELHSYFCVYQVIHKISSSVVADFVWGVGKCESIAVGRYAQLKLNRNNLLYTTPPSGLTNWDQKV